MSWRTRLGRRRPPDDVEAELEFHLEMQTRRYEEAGLDHERARARARERLGDLQNARDACRAIADQMETDMERTAWWQGVGQDVSYGLRLLRRTPTFTMRRSHARDRPGREHRDRRRQHGADQTVLSGG